MTTKLDKTVLETVVNLIMIMDNDTLTKVNIFISGLEAGRNQPKEIKEEKQNAKECIS